MSSTDQIELIAVAPPKDDSIGSRHSCMLEEAITAAEEQGLIEPLDKALLSIARANAHALDAAEALGKKGGYLVSAITGPYREVLQSLRMTPKDRNEDTNAGISAAAAALAALGTPAVRNT